MRIGVLVFTCLLVCEAVAFARSEESSIDKLVDQSEQVGTNLKSLFSQLFHTIQENVETIKSQPFVKSLVNATQNLKPKLLQGLVNYLNHTTSTISPSSLLLKRKRQVQEEIFTNETVENEMSNNSTGETLNHKFDFLFKTGPKNSSSSSITDEYLIDFSSSSNRTNQTEMANSNEQVIETVTEMTNLSDSTEDLTTVTTPTAIVESTSTAEDISTTMSTSMSTSFSMSTIIEQTTDETTTSAKVVETTTEVETTTITTTITSKVELEPTISSSTTIETTEALSSSSSSSSYTG